MAPAQIDVPSGTNNPTTTFKSAGSFADSLYITGTFFNMDEGLHDVEVDLLPGNMNELNVGCSFSCTDSEFPYTVTASAGLPVGLEVAALSGFVVLLVVVLWSIGRTTGTCRSATETDNLLIVHFWPLFWLEFLYRYGLMPVGGAIFFIVAAATGIVFADRVLSLACAVGALMLAMMWSGVRSLVLDADARTVTLINRFCLTCPKRTTWAFDDIKGIVLWEATTNYGTTWRKLGIKLNNNSVHYLESWMDACPWRLRVYDRVGKFLRKHSVIVCKDEDGVIVATDPRTGISVSIAHSTVNPVAAAGAYPTAPPAGGTPGAYPTDLVSPAAKRPRRSSMEQRATDDDGPGAPASAGLGCPNCLGADEPMAVAPCGHASLCFACLRRARVKAQADGQWPATPCIICNETIDMEATLSNFRGTKA